MGVAERREREREERRNRILDAAGRVFFDTSPVEATMDDVAAAAELSKGTLYLYFKSKDDLYLAIAHRGLSLLVGRMQETVAQGAERTGFELLEQISAHNRRFGREHPEHLKSMLAWMASGFRASPDSPGFAEYQALVSNLFRIVVGIIERGKADGSIRPDVNALEAVMHLWGGTMGVWMLYFSRAEVSNRVPMLYDFERLVPSFQETFLRALKNTEGES